MNRQKEELEIVLRGIEATLKVARLHLRSILGNRYDTLNLDAQEVHSIMSMIGTASDLGKRHLFEVEVAHILDRKYKSKRTKREARKPEKGFDTRYRKRPSPFSSKEPTIWDEEE